MLSAKPIGSVACGDLSSCRGNGCIRNAATETARQPSNAAEDTPRRLRPAFRLNISVLISEWGAHGASNSNKPMARRHKATPHISRRPLRSA